MRSSFWTLFGIVFLGLHQSTFARRGGSSGGGSNSDSGSSGGSNSGSSSGSGNSGGSSGSHCLDGGGSVAIGNISNPFDYLYKDQWLYKFVGSYYNGSVEIEATIDMKDVSCDDQKPVFKQKLDAVLMVGEQLTNVEKPNLSPYMFSLVGWKEGTKPGGGTPSWETKWVSPDARLIYDSISDSRSPFMKYATWTIDNQKSSDGYLFDAVFTDDLLHYDESRTIFSISPCNGSQPVDFHMAAYDKYDFMYRTTGEHEQQRTRANGTFSKSTASLSIAGEFSGKFMNWYSWYSSSSGSSDDPKYGLYKLRFTGALDQKHSHALNTDGPVPSWTKDKALLPGSPTGAAAGIPTACTGGSGALSGSTRVGVGKGVFGLASLMGVGMVVASW